MFERILNQLRERVRTRQYVMTIHADEEMNEDDLTIFDVESVVLSGKIIERQKKRQRRMEISRQRRSVEWQACDYRY